MKRSLFLALFVLVHFPAQAGTIIPAFPERPITPTGPKIDCFEQSGSNMSSFGDFVTEKDVLGELVKFLLPSAGPGDTAEFESTESRAVGASV
ncbi:MAG TPA: hypothetical protein PKZ41_00745 [Candidatus Omnitrophota bacterium]|nr:hypothetical protein [Candidatus Omnitrophota bacterium]